MKVLVYTGPRQARIEEVPDQPLRDGEVRVQTIYTGISHGTEMSVYRGLAPFWRRERDPNTGLFSQSETPQVWQYPVRSCDPGVWYMGYANVGRVVEARGQIEDLTVGDTVFAAAPHQSQTVGPAERYRKVPDSLEPLHAIFFTNLMTTFNGILDAGVHLGSTAVVSGLGVLGQLVAQMLRASGAMAVFGVDPIERRRKTAAELGMTRAFDPDEGTDIARQIRELTEGRGADVVIEVSGNQAGLNEAIRIAAPDTAVVALGWYQGTCQALDLSEEFHHNRVTIRCSQTGGIAPALRHLWNQERKERVCMKLLGELDLNPLVSHRIPYSEAPAALRMIDRRPDEVIQVALEYTEKDDEDA